jgi:hypothetical protein
MKQEAKVKVFAGLAAAALCIGASAPLPTALVIDVTLTPRAAQRLAALGEGITIAAYHDGEPTKAHVKQADKMYRIALGIDRLTVSGRAQRVTMPLAKLDRSRLSWVVEPHLLINVVSAMHKKPLNLLDCGNYDGPLAGVRGKPIAIKCDLI